MQDEGLTGSRLVDRAPAVCSRLPPTNVDLLCAASPGLFSTRFQCRFPNIDLRVCADTRKIAPGVNSSMVGVDHAMAKPSSAPPAAVSVTLRRQPTIGSPSRAGYSQPAANT